MIKPLLDGGVERCKVALRDFCKTLEHKTIWGVRFRNGLGQIVQVPAFRPFAAIAAGEQYLLSYLVLRQRKLNVQLLFAVRPNRAEPFFRMVQYRIKQSGVLRVCGEARRAGAILKPCGGNDASVLFSNAVAPGRRIIVSGQNLSVFSEFGIASLFTVETAVFLQK